MLSPTLSAGSCGEPMLIVVDCAHCMRPPTGRSGPSAWLSPTMLGRQVSEMMGVCKELWARTLNSTPLGLSSSASNPWAPYVQPCSDPFAPNQTAGTIYVWIRTEYVCMYVHLHACRVMAVALSIWLHAREAIKDRWIDCRSGYLDESWISAFHHHNTVHGATRDDRCLDKYSRAVQSRSAQSSAAQKRAEGKRLRMRNKTKGETSDGQSKLGQPSQPEELTVGKDRQAGVHVGDGRGRKRAS